MVKAVSRPQGDALERTGNSHKDSWGCRRCAAIEEGLVGRCRRCPALQKQNKAIAQGLAGLALRMYNWSIAQRNLTHEERIALVELVLMYVDPCEGVEGVVEEASTSLHNAVESMRSLSSRRNAPPHADVTVTVSAGSSMPSGLRTLESMRLVSTQDSQKPPTTSTSPPVAQPYPKPTSPYRLAPSALQHPLTRAHGAGRSVDPARLVTASPAAGRTGNEVSGVKVNFQSSRISADELNGFYAAGDFPDVLGRPVFFSDSTRKFIVFQED
eukprot:6074633-Amphidinium_carterae.1